MGWFSSFLGKISDKPAPETPWPFDPYDAAQRVLPDPWEPYNGALDVIGIPIADPGVPLASLSADKIEKLWRSQPNLREVIDFIARQVASIPLHVYDRVSDTDRRRVRDHPLARAVSSPAPRMGAYRFWHAALSDALLYDRLGILASPSETTAGDVSLWHLPSDRLHFKVDQLRRLTGARFMAGQGAGADGDGWVTLPLDQLLADFGYAPTTAGLSPVVTLAAILAEDAEAVRFRRELWTGGGRFRHFLKRPAEARWTNEARERFLKDFRSQYTGAGAGRPGGLPLLEDGMDIGAVDGFSPTEMADLEGRKLSAEEVARAFHIPPELMGIRPGNYSNMAAFRSSLYRDYLGPYIVAWESMLNAQLKPMLAEGTDLYVEANVEAKLRGSFEEQVAYLQSATGAPYMTRGEARSRLNLPSIPGADDLVVPLNVLTGGQASPRDSGTQNRSAASPGPRVKAAAPPAFERRVEKLFADFFGRQGRSVREALAAGSSSWWDAKRWDRELGEDVLRAGAMVSQETARAALEAAGIEPGSYDVERTLAFLTAVAGRIAQQVNDTTREEIEAALDAEDGDRPRQAVADEVFEKASSWRAPLAAVTATTTFAAFGTVEAGRQSGAATKTWVVNSSNPRASHAAMNGETVPIDGVFSNGLEWPGGLGADVDEVAGCQCSLIINY